MVLKYTDLEQIPLLNKCFQHDFYGGLFFTGELFFIFKEMSVNQVMPNK